MSDSDTSDLVRLGCELVEKATKLMEEGRFKKAYPIFVQAAKINNPDGCYRAALCCELGVGNKKDDHAAFQLFRKGASLGHPLSMWRLAKIYLEGEFKQHRNLKEGLKWLKRAADCALPNRPDPLYELARFYEPDANCPLIIPDPFYALELYREAASWNYAPALHRLGRCYELGQLCCQVDPEASITYYTRAAEQGYPPAELALAKWWASGYLDLMQASETEAFYWTRKAAEHGLPQAQYELGTLYEGGIGVKESEAEAIKWYEKALRKGYAKASFRLEAINYRKEQSHPKQSVLVKLLKRIF